jgi:putative DNA primase/helicase
MSREGVKELADAVAGTNPFHPGQQWIEATPWDGVPRAKQFHESFELVDPSHAPLRAALLDAWMLQGIGAVFETEGIAAQGILVLNGAQDVFKTRKIENLCPVAGAVRTGIHLDPLDKDSVFQGTSAWIVELGEIDSTFRKADVSAMKAFVTRNEDILRRPYAKVDNTYRRRTIFAGTVNGSGFLADSTGDRRFWTLEVKLCHLLPGEVMQQVWAEYLVRYRASERWHLRAETKAALNASNADHRVVDPLRERIQTAFDWAKVEGENWHSKPNVVWLTATDVCIRVGVTHPSRADSTRAGAIVVALNNKVFRKSNGAKLLALPALTGGRL